MNTKTRLHFAEVMIEEKVDESITRYETIFRLIEATDINDAIGKATKFYNKFFQGKKKVINVLVTTVLK